MTKRIRAQSGAFTLHGACIDPPDYYPALMPHITKIFIPFTSTKAIQASLQQVGVTESFIYPELVTIARDIARMESSAYVWRANRYVVTIKVKTTGTQKTLEILIRSDTVISYIFSEGHAPGIATAAN